MVFGPSVSFSSSSTSPTSSASSPPSPFPLYLLPSLPFQWRRRSSTSTNATALSTSPASDRAAHSSGGGGVEEQRQPSYLTGNESLLRCTKCLVDLCPTSQIISKGFTGRHGRAYLVSGSASTVYSVSTPHSPPASPPSSALSSRLGRKGGKSAGPAVQSSLLNIHVHKPVPRQLVTGLHTVADISCAHCGSILGWKYVAAEEEGQRYKVGKFILETKKICRGVEWECEEGAGLAVLEQQEERRTRRGLNGLADSDDEEGPRDEEDEEIVFDSQDEDECEDLFAGVWSPALAKRRRKNRGWA